MNIRRTSDERGVSVSAFFAMIFPVLLLICGLAIDGAAHANAMRTAEVVAAQAARAGADAASPAVLAGTDGSSLALSAANASLAGHGSISGSASIDAAGQLVVVTHTVAPTTFLKLIGIDHLQASGEATAKLNR